MKALVSLPTFAVVLFLDVISKAVAVAVLSPAGIPRPAACVRGRESSAVVQPAFSSAFSAAS